MNGARLAAWAGDVFDGSGPVPWPRYSSALANALGLNNHFQGVQRLRNGPYLAVTGSDAHSRTAHLFVVEMASRPQTGRFGSNLVRAQHPRLPVLVERPPDEDVIRARLDLDQKLWHAGGLSALGSLLAIPLDDGRGSRVVFYDTENPLEPVSLLQTIERPDSRAASVSLARLEDGHYLVAVRTGKLIDFYTSLTERFADGFDSSRFVRWRAPGLIPEVTAAIADSQNLNFLSQCDGRLFLIGMHNTALLTAPVIPGLDMALLFEATLPENDTSQVPRIRKVAQQVMSCDNGKQCNFDAAAGSFVTEEGELLIYATNHFRHPLTPLDGIIGGPTVFSLNEY